MRTAGLALLALAASLALPGTASATGLLTVERVLVAGGDGVVQSAEGLIFCPSTCSATRPLSHTYTLTALPAPGSALLGWTGCDSSAGPTCTILVEHAPDIHVDGNVTPRVNPERVAVTFAAVHRLTVRRGGAGSGTVTGESAGISCGTTCESAIVSGTPVTLTAVPAAGSFFAGWRGECSGTGTCTVVLDRVRDVTALFGRVLTAGRLRASPARPAAGRLLTLRLRLDGDAVGLTTSCTASVGGRSIRLLRRIATEQLVVCRWRVPRRPRGRVLRAIVETSDAYADIERRFVARIRGGGSR